MAAGESFDVVVVGGGPRAVSLVERLTARLRSHREREGLQGPPAEPLLRLAVIDAVEVGPGATWRTDQTAQFLNNTTAAETTLYPDESTPIDGPRGGGPTFVEWAEETVRRGRHELPWVIEEARGIGPHSFTSRRLQGVYYAEQLARAEAAGFVSVRRVVGLAVGLERADEGTRVVRLADGLGLRGRAVVLAQGMVQARPDASVRAFAEGAARLGLRYIEPGMPAERPWHEVPAGEDCIVQGLGANFYDVVAELTAGRGGRFEAVEGDGLGRLRYLPSGEEPRLHAVSRRGVPYRGKGATGPSGKPRYGVPTFASPEWFDSLEAAGDPLHFGRDVWPTIAAEFAHAFAAALVARDASAVPAGIDRLRAALAAEIARLAAERGSRDGAAAAVNARLDAILAARLDRPEGHPEAFRLDQLRRPTGGERVTEEQWRLRVAEMIEHELDSIGRPYESPKQAVNLAMAAVRGRVGRLAARGLIEGRSAVAEVHGWFDADGLFLASGPPVRRTRQVLALIEAGVLELVGPESAVEIDEADRRFAAHSRITGACVRAGTLIETRMSKGKVPNTDDPLLRSLLDSGRGRVHRLPAGDASGELVETESIEAMPPDDAHDPLALVDAQGVVDPRVLLLGIPASSTQPGSAIGAAPGVPSPLLAGADIAARSLIGALIRSAPPLPVLRPAPRSAIPA